MKIPLYNEGLNSEQVEQQRAKFGLNALEKSKSVFWVRVLQSAKEPMLLLLFACSLIYMLIGDFWSGFVFLGWTSLVLLSSIYRNYRAANVLAALDEFAQPTCVVIREGKQRNVKRQDLVVLDSVLLKEGTRIPADGLLMSGTYLKVDESMLTGESVAIEKTKMGSALFSGTMVVKGEGIMQVNAIGKQAEIGKISVLLANDKITQISPLQKSIKKFVRYSFLFAISIAVLITLIYALTRGAILEAVLNGLSTAMAILPEEFPLVLTLFFSLTAWRLAQKNVLTSRISVLEILGSTSILCTDKTGTLTQNKMSVKQTMVVPLGVATLSSSLTKEQEVRMAQTALLACPVFSHDAMEDAIRLEFKLMKQQAWPVKQSYPISGSCFAMANLYDNEALPYNVHCKGAPEEVMNLCKVNKKEQQSILETLNQMASTGLRILGFARAKHHQETALADIRDYQFELVGFIGFEDPIRPGVSTAVKKLQDAGIQLIMATGDYPLTAQSIALQAGFSLPLHCLNGKEIALEGKKLHYKDVQHVNIFSRILPGQKLALVRLLQKNGAIVAMIGDGINDAPALQAADVGIAMGEKGADVAREAASIVLLKDQFEEIVNAIEMGRHLFYKLQNALLYIVAIHIPIIGLCVLPALFNNLPIFLLPFHIAFLELIIDPACTLAFENAPKEKGLMKKPPVDIQNKLITKNNFLKSLSYGLVILTGVLLSYLMSWTQNETAAQQRLLSFCLLVCANLILIVHTLSRTKTSWQVLKESGWITKSILIFSVIALLLVLAIPTLRSAFNFELPGFLSSVFTLIVLMLTALVLKWLD